MVNNEMFQRTLSKDVFSTSWVKVCLIDYKAELVTCSAMEDDMPVFCQISNILLLENHTFISDKHAIPGRFSSPPTCNQSAEISKTTVYCF